MKVRLFGFITLFSFIYGQDDNAVFSHRPLLILYDTNTETIRDLLDNKTHHLQASTLVLCSALIDKAAPIVLSASLMHNFLSRKIMFRDLVNLNTVDLQKKYGDYPLFQAITIKTAQKECANLLSKAQLSPVFAKEFYDLLSNETIYTNLFLVYTVNFTAKDWVVRKLGDFYLLIPREYLHKWAPAYKIDELIKPADLVPEEQKSGFKFQHFSPVPASFFETFVDNTPIANGPAQFLALLPKLFVSVTEYQKIIKKDSSMRIPLWHIYLGGHGSRTKSNIHAVERGLQKQRTQLRERITELERHKAGSCIQVLHAIENGLNIPDDPIECKNMTVKKIFDDGKLYAFKIRDKRAPILGVLAGLPVPYFTQVLLFFNAYIASRFLFVCSCFAAGENLAEPYKLAGVPFALNYTVASQALTEEVTYALASNVGIFKKSQDTKNRFTIAPAFRSFFDILLTEEPVSSASKKLFNPFVDAAAYAAGFFDETGRVIDPLEKKFAINNLVWMRVPGTTWFSFATFRERTMVFNRMLVTRYAVERLRTPFAINKKSLILLETDIINFPIKISAYQDYLPQIISIMPGSATHRFDERVTITGSLENFVNMILRQERKRPAVSIEPTKQFYVKLLVCKSGRFTKSYQDVLIIKNLSDKDKTYNAVYLFDMEQDKRLGRKWDVTQSTFAAEQKNLLDIPAPVWKKIEADFSTLETVLKKKFALIFKEYSSLEEAYKAALQATQKRLEIMPAIQEYGLYLKNNPAQAEQFLKTLTTSQQDLVKRIFYSPELDLQKLADFRVRLRALGSL